MIITKSLISSVLSYNEKSGVFTRLKDNSRYWQAGDFAGTLSSKGYVVLSLGGSLKILAHRAAWILMTGENAPGQIDHIDGNKLNNAWSNLRVATNMQNCQNKKKARSDSVSGLLGAFYVKSKNKYDAYICVKGKRIYLGRYAAAKDAHEAYIKAKRELHEFCTI